MDVQTENVDPPPCESQPSGKIRKGFKLFGKHKPGNIFSIRSKGDGNNKSPVTRSKTTDGLSDTAPDSEQEPDKEKAQEVSLGEREQAEEEPLGEDGVMAAAPARTSISSASSAKSLSFLSLLRGGRRGVGDRRAHTVSQPVGRQRRGLKGLFGNVRFRSKDKDDKEDAPPSPLLMSSRANSVEIIKEDLTLTPKSQPRSLDSPVTEPAGSLAAQDSAATSPSETMSPHVTTDSVSRTNEHASLLPGSELPLVPGDTSLSSLLADISSLLTFDSISGGGDIMADVEAEWGKVSSALSAAATEVTPPSTSLLSKPAISSPVKLSHVAVPTAASSQYFTPLTKTSTFSPPAKPSSGITSLTESLTSSPPSAKLSSDSTTVSEPSISIKTKSAPLPPATKPSTAQVALTSPSAPITSSTAVTVKPTLSSTSATTTAPPNTPATVVKAPSVSPLLTSTATKLTSGNAAPAQVTASVGKPGSVASPSARLPPVILSSPTPASLSQVPPSKLDSASSLVASTSYKPFTNAAAGESKAPVTVSACADITTPASPEPVFPSKITTATTSTTTSASVAVALPKSTFTSIKTEINNTPPSLVSVSSSAPTTTTKAQPSPPSVPAPSSAPLEKIPCITKPTPAPDTLDTMPPAPTPTSFPTTWADISPDLGQIPVSQFKAHACAQMPVSVLKHSSAPTQVQVDKFKAPPAPAQISVPVSKGLPVPAQIPVSGSKEPPAPAQIPVSISKDPFVLTPAPCPVTSVPSTSPQWSVKGSGQAVDGQLTSPSGLDTHGAQVILSKTEKIHNESQTNLQGSSRDKRTPQVKASGLSKIPVVGGGRGAKLPASQQVDDEASRVPPSPVLQEERPSFNSHDAENKDKIFDAEVSVATSRDTQEGNQQPAQKALTSLPRDSKIPVKHVTQSHAVSQIPQAKEPQRSKIPVSKVPVRAAVKPAASGGSSHVRK